MPEISPALIDGAWAKGILHWKLRPIQQLMYQREASSQSLKWVENCSRRLGKSFRLAVRATETAIRIPNALIPFAAPTGKMLRAINIPIFRKICHDAPPDVKPEWKQADSKFTFPNGSEITLAGVNNGHADDLRGREATEAYVDEAGFVDDLEYLIEDVLMPQLLTTGGKLIMSSSPSRTPAHDFARYCHEAQMEGNYAEYDIYQSGYPADLIEKFRAEANGPTWNPGDPDSSTWLREYMCRFVVDENYAIIPEWKPEYETPIATDKYFPFYQLYEGMDMGAVDKTVVIFGYYDFLNAALVILDEIVMHGPAMTTEKLAAAIKAREKELWPERSKEFDKKPGAKPARIADNNNPIMLLDLASMHGISFTPTQKTGKTERQTILESMVNDLRIQVAAGRVKVHPRCKETIGCLRYGVWEEKRRTFDRSSVYGHYDALAALIYLNRNVNRSHNPIPATFQLSQNTHFISDDLKKKKEHEEIKKIFSFKRRRPNARRG